MTNKEKIEEFARRHYRDRDAAGFVSRWLSSFYANADMTETMLSHVQIFSGFGGSSFFRSNHGMLYLACSHALMCYAEGVVLLSREDKGAGVMAIMQGIEPAIIAARIAGEDPVTVRPALVALIESINAESPGARNA